MTGLALAAAVPLPATEVVSGGEAVLFWLLAPVMVLAGLGLVFVRKAVHAALLLVLNMVCLAVLYAAQDAPFLFAAQIVVYTGAVMMVFLFVLMLVGVDASDSLTETIRNQRALAAVAGVGLLVLLVGVVRQLTGADGGFPSPQGLAAANGDGNAVGVARLIFGDDVFAFELTGALLITAALGALVLTHQERLTPRTTQRTLSQRRVREGTQVPPLPAPGFFARHNSVDTPALLPDGSPSELSVSRVLRARGQEASAAAHQGEVAVIEAEITGRTTARLTGTQSPGDLRVDASSRPVEPAGPEPQEPTP